MKFLRTYESWSKQEYIEDVVSGLKKYNIRPLELNKIVDQYEDEILDFYDSGKNPNLFVDKITKDLELDKDGGFMQIRTGPKPQTQIHHQ